jgi:hypothetical protein
MAERVRWPPESQEKLFILPESKIRPTARNRMGMQKRERVFAGFGAQPRSASDIVTRPSFCFFVKII